MDRALRVLHLPVNTASQISVSVRALRDIGVNARGLAVQPAVVQSQTEIEVIPAARRRHPWNIVRRFWKVASAIAWADVVHWHFGATTLAAALDVQLAARWNKARVVEFWGSDIRIPEIATADNPYLARLGQNHEYGQSESLARSRRVQALFSHHGFECLIPSEELMPYVQRDLFPFVHTTRQRVLLDEYEPCYPDPHQRRVRIVHSPTAPLYKGTPSVLAAIELLKSRWDIEFILVKGVAKEEAKRIVSTADIFLDQFIGGDYGLAAVEAMALGKPVLCYVKPSLQNRSLSGSPIINANPDNLTSVLENLLQDGEARHEIGKRSRAFVEKYHDAHQIAADLVGIYRSLLARRMG